MKISRFIANQLEYVLRPANILHRIRYDSQDKEAQIELRLPNGLKIRVRLSEPVGKSLYNHRVYDMAMAETLYRLVDPADKVLDVGANVGYTALIMSLKTKPENIQAFEPHPITFSELQYNLLQLNNLSGINLHNIGLSSESNKALLFTSSTGHRGGSHIAATGKATETSVEVQVKKLDDLISEPMGLMKIDVEGHEINVFKGAERTFSKQWIRDVVFEEHNPYPYATYHFLEEKGYTIYRIGKAMAKPVLLDKTDHLRYTNSWEPKNYLATVDPERARKLLHPRGWHVI